MILGRETDAGRRLRNEIHRGCAAVVRTSALQLAIASGTLLIFVIAAR